MKSMVINIKRLVSTVKNENNRNVTTEHSESTSPKIKNRCCMLQKQHQWREWKLALNEWESGSSGSVCQASWVPTAGKWMNTELPFENRQEETNVLWWLEGDPNTSSQDRERDWNKVCGTARTQCLGIRERWQGPFHFKAGTEIINLNRRWTAHYFSTCTKTALLKQFYETE